MIVLDTTGLVYAVGTDHPLRAPCRAIIAAASRGTLSATTTVEVIQELTHVRARRRDRADAASLALDYADVLAPLLVVDDNVLRLGLDLFGRHETVGAFDAALASVTLHHGATLVSANHAFAAIDGLDHVDPAMPALADRLPGLVIDDT